MIEGPRAARQEELPAVVALSNMADAEMIFLARSFGCASRSTGMQGTLKIIDPPAFFEALKPRLLARLSPEDRPAFSAEMMQVTAAEDLAARVFGSMEREPPRSLHPVFPLPLPGYGLNYI